MSMGRDSQKSEHRGTVLVTGTSTGIGRATALELDGRGYRVFAGVRREEDAASLRREASGRLRPLILDITRFDQIEEAVRSIREGQGSPAVLHGLVNNAGTGMVAPLEFLPLEHIREHLEVNLMGHLAVTQAFLPAIRAGGGRIINITSANARFPLPFFVPYVAARAAFTAASDALRRELREWRIPVSVVELGFVETGIYDRGETATRELIESLPEKSSDLYRDRFLEVVDFLGRGRSRAARAEIVAGLVCSIMKARRPRTVYRCGPGSVMALLGSRLPGRVGDWVLAKLLAGKLPSFLAGL